MKRSSTIVLATIGSLGDLYPYLALAEELASRGFEPLLAANPFHRQMVEKAGIRFHPVRPDLSQYPDKEMVSLATHPTRSSEYIIRRMILPYLEESYRDLLPLIESSAFVVSHPLFYAAKLAAEKVGVPWAVGALQPSIFFSIYDPPVIARTPFAEHLRFLGPPFYRLFFRLIKTITRSWTRPLVAFRRSVGLPERAIDPLVDGQFSHELTLALFSPLFAPEQPDWPTNSVATGFPFYRDEDDPPALPAGLDEFLDAGEAPIVFTLGSLAVFDPGRFFPESVAAARSLGRRAVLLVGDESSVDPSLARAEDVFVVPFASHRALFPRAVAIVHQGGIGTTAEALRAAKPMLIVPFANDQPDNARRATRLGVARTIRRAAYRSSRVAEELARLLETPEYKRTAEEVAARLRRERGAAVACTAVERALDRPSASAEVEDGPRGMAARN